MVYLLSSSELLSPVLLRVCLHQCSVRGIECVRELPKDFSLTSQQNATQDSLMAGHFLMAAVKVSAFSQAALTPIRVIISILVAFDV